MPSYSTAVPDVMYVTEFNQAMTAALQINMDPVSGTFSQGSYTGEKAEIVTEIGTVEMLDVNSRDQKIVHQDASLTQRWIYPASFYVSQKSKTNIDLMRMLTDPSSEQFRLATDAANRKKLNLALSAFFATAYTGLKGQDAEAWDNAVYTPSTGIGQNIGITTGAVTDAGMNIAKIEAVEELFAVNLVPETETIHMVLTARQRRDLRNQIQVASNEFNGAARYDSQGQLIGYGRVNFIYTQMITPSVVSQALCGSTGASANCYALPVWTGLGMHFGTWNGVRTDVDALVDVVGRPIQTTMYLDANATRRHPKRVARVFCAV